MIKCGEKTLSKGEKTFIMGVLNVTPDSFSDGGDFLHHETAIEHGRKLYEEGADIIDIGGVSTAPHAPAVSLQEELDRVIPVIENLKLLGISNISIDTKRAPVAELALSAGASWVNDQSAGLFDENMPHAMKKADAVVIMHDGGGLSSGVDAGEAVGYQDLLSEIADFFAGRIKELACAGVSPDKIILDPGIGFGKGEKDSLSIINNMHRFSGAMNLIGVSRKSVIGKITGLKDPKNRDYASLGAHAAAVFSGANIIRTHRVLETKQMMQVLDRCLKERRGEYEDLHQAR